MAVHSEGDWLVAWDAEDPKLWDKSLAWKTLVITTFNMTFCFVAWFLPVSYTHLTLPTKA